MRLSVPAAPALLLVAVCGGCTPFEAVPCDPVGAALPDQPAVGPAATLATPMHRDDGNRAVAGTLDLAGSRTLALPLPFVPEWVVALPDGDGSVWVATAQGSAPFAVRVPGQAASADEVTPTELLGTPRTLASPPTLVRSGDGFALLDAGGADRSALAPPRWLGDGSLWITCEGEVVRGDADGAVSATERIGALPDARVTRSGDLIAVLGDATTRYGHGALGDETEGGAIYVLDVAEGLAVRTRIALGGDAVIEGTSVAWADLSGDGSPELLATASNLPSGARHRVYDPNTGELLGESEAAGANGFWRHRLGAADFTGDGVELAAVRTPHVGGVAEFLTLGAQGLVHTAEAEMYRTHVFSSRNLDQGLIGDFDADGRPDLLVSSQDQRSLAVLRRASSAEQQEGEEPVAEPTRLLLPSTLASNVFATPHGAGLAVGAALDDATLLLFLDPVR